MNTIFNTNDLNEILQRVETLHPGSQRQWGKMTPAQMLAHCNGGMRMALGEIKPPRTFLGLLFGKMVRRELHNTKTFPHGGPTYKGFVVKDERDFEKEKATFIELARKVNAAGENGITKHKHPFFGKLTPAEWGQLQWKHFNHHLTQFGV